MIYILYNNGRAIIRDNRVYILHNKVSCEGLLFGIIQHIMIYILHNNGMVIIRDNRVYILHNIGRAIIRDNRVYILHNGRAIIRDNRVYILHNNGRAAIIRDNRVYTSFTIKYQSYNTDFHLCSYISI